MANTIKFFNADIDGVKFGSVDIDKVYVGDTLIWGGGSSVPVTGVQLSQTSITMDVGSSSALTATVLPNNASDKSVTWSSSDSTIISVNTAGTITELSTGVATITVTTNDGGFTASCAVESALMPASNNQIRYMAASKLQEVTGTGNTNGVHVEVFSGTSGQLTKTSHVYDSTTKIGVITFNGTITSVGNRAFFRCSGSTSAVTSIGIPDTVTSIGSSCCNGCSAMTSFHIPPSLTEIGSYAFGNCYSLNNIRLPNTLITLGNSSFEKCSGLTSIEIPDSVTEIGTDSFNGCRSLARAIVGSGDATIPGNLFNSCVNIKHIDFKGTNITSFSQNVCNATKFDAIIIRTASPVPTIIHSQGGSNTWAYETSISSTSFFYVPDSAVSSYKNASNWSYYKSHIKGLSELPT